MFRELYFDTAATTPLLNEVKQVLMESLDTYGNPSSLHRKGIDAQKRVERARQQVLRTLGATGRVIFTASGTEANNLALFGIAQKYAQTPRHLVTTEIEHPSVLETCRALERRGWRVTYVAPEADGRVEAQKVLAAVTSETVLVSMMQVNNETGAILPIEEVGTALKANPRVVFHVDGIQAFGKFKHGAKWADLYSLSGHKIGAPKGVGALYTRPNLTLEPMLFGGGQESGLRSGTENVLSITALGEAAKVAVEKRETALNHTYGLAQSLVQGLAQIDGCVIQRTKEASPYIVSAAFPGLKGEVLVHALETKGLYVSTGSACSSKGGHTKASHVLQAMKYSKRQIEGTIRFSVGSWHTMEDILDAVNIVQEQTRWLHSVV
ncbi:MAG: hypothetical protein A2201_12535 [Alicyclobacillus sp. RIFOXYA1_FULL_53_8]|nr:MAG: hypothetical protein A2201_12535 [Alicyclobacillus sp. RIFOXYA1_FULL_53_8]